MEDNKLMTLEQARNVLRVDEGDNDELITSLMEAIPSYIETATGMKEDQQIKEPMAKTAAGFILTLWYYADKADDKALNRTIEALLKSLTYKARG